MSLRVVVVYAVIIARRLARLICDVCLSGSLRESGKGQDASATAGSSAMGDNLTCLALPAFLPAPVVSDGAFLYCPTLHADDSDDLTSSSE